MKAFMVKSYWVQTIISQIILVVFWILIRSHFEWKGEPPSYLLLLWLLGVILIPISNLSIMYIHNIAKTNDEIDEQFKIANNKSDEADKLIAFLKNKAFASTIVNRDEVFEHMGWENKSEKDE